MKAWERYAVGTASTSTFRGSVRPRSRIVLYSCTRGSWVVLVGRGPSGSYYEDTIVRSAEEGLNKPNSRTSDVVRVYFSNHTVLKT